MAFPVVEATASGISTASPIIASLPSGSVSGDLIVVYLKNAASGTWTQDPPTSGWTEVFDANGAALYYKQIGALEPTPSFRYTTTTVRACYISYRISGHEDPATQAPEASSGATGSSSSPNPDSLTPTGGAKDYLWIAVDGVNDGRRDHTGAPGAPGEIYTNLISVSAGGGPSGVGAGSAELQHNDSSEDPDVFTLSGSGTWYARTIAIHPAPAVTRRIFIVS
jgi:hypothetical protein